MDAMRMAVCGCAGLVMLVGEVRAAEAGAGGGLPVGSLVAAGPAAVSGLQAGGPASFGGSAGQLAGAGATSAGTAAWMSPQLRASRSAQAAVFPSVALAGGIQTGDVVVTEIMKDPSAVTDLRGEWIEVRNNRPCRVNLEGWILTDDAGNVHVIANGGNGVRIRPGGLLVLGASADQTLNGGVPVAYQWSGYSLGNAADSVILARPNGEVVDRVAYDDGVLWPDLPGRSIQVRNEARQAQLNDDPSWWCHSTTPISPVNSDSGTPGYDNDPCQ